MTHLIRQQVLLSSLYSLIVKEGPFFLNSNILSYSTRIIGSIGYFTSITPTHSQSYRYYSIEIWFWFWFDLLSFLTFIPSFNRSISLFINDNHFSHDDSYMNCRFIVCIYTQTTWTYLVLFLMIVIVIVVLRSGVDSWIYEFMDSWLMD